jgi:hypothetical protein
LSELNSHIRIHGPIALICGNSLTYLHHLREATNELTSRPNRIKRGRGKVEFAEYVTSAGGRAPKTIAFVAHGLVRRAAPGSENVAAFLTKTQEGHYFCKPDTGRNGIGAFRLTISPDGPLMDEEPSSFAAVAERLSSQDYIIQEWMVPLQHPDIARFRNGVINTMRLVTFDTDSGAIAVAASLRMATYLKSIDSWTQGGIAAPIDLERGILMPFGLVKKELKLVEAHPGSGVLFRDQPVPHCHQAVTMACRMHNQLDAPKTLGWDIGLLEEGPCFLENNSAWDFLLSALFAPNLIPKFLSLQLPPACASAVRVLLTGTFTDRITTCWALSRVLGTAMASGRVEGVSRGQLLFTLGGDERVVETALQVFKLKGSDFGVSGVKIAQTHERPAPGFDASAVFA